MCLSVVLAASAFGVAGCRSAVKDFYEPLLEPPPETECSAAGSGGTAGSGGSGATGTGGMDAGCNAGATTGSTTEMK